MSANRINRLALVVAGLAIPTAVMSAVPPVVIPEDETAPTVTERYYAPPITVASDRIPVDMRITADVMDEIASDPRVSGQVGVDTDSRVVMLTGLVATRGEALRAERDAHRVPGIREVRNYVRSEVGG